MGQQAGGRKELQFKPKGMDRQSSFLLREVRLVYTEAFDWTKPTYNSEGSLLYPKTAEMLMSS